MARHCRPDDGRAANQREILEHLPGGTILVTATPTPTPAPTTTRFEFATAGRILFGPGVLQQFQPDQFGKRAFVIGGRNLDRLAPLTALLKKNGIAQTSFAVAGEPTVDLVRQGVEAARAGKPDFVIGFGGGSAIDAAKAIAALLTNPGDLFDYLEVIGNAKPLAAPPVPCVAIPTTAGAGAEVTRNAVLASPQHGVKVSLRHPLMLPRLAIVDPELTLDLPPHLTAATGMDALTQLIEPYVSVRATPMTDLLCIDGIARAAKSLRRAFENGKDIAARTEMSLASLYGGMTLANAGLGAVHGFAAAIGGMFQAPHGAICARLLAAVMEANINSLADNPKLATFRHIAQLLTGNHDATANDGVEWVRNLCQTLKIPPLGAYGIKSGDVSNVCDKAAAASSMKANPVGLPREILHEILSATL